LTLSDRSKEIKAAFEPIIEAMRDLNGLMLGVIGGINAVYDGLRAVDREVAVEFNHGVTGIDQVGAVHLDFVVILSEGKRGRED
jgi:hypothetical protein